MYSHVKFDRFASDTEIESEMIEKDENRSQFSTPSSSMPDAKASVSKRREWRRRATTYTLAISAVCYLVLLLRPGLYTDDYYSNHTYRVKSDISTHILSTQDAHLLQQQQRSLSKNPDRHFHAAADNHDFAEYSCESLNDLTTVHGPLTQEAKCDFAQTCNDGDGLFAPIVYCHPTLSTRTLMLLLSPPLILFLCVLFRILGSTAEEFFSPGLEMYSLKMGLPERFAGVTLLALGNGAPDVASTVNAILDDRKRGYLMALGELTGAAMVASTLIVGAVVHIAGGVVCKGAMVRDVLMFILTMAVVYKSFEDGSISVGEIRWFVGLYAGYVVLVLGSDLYHKYVYMPRKRRLQQEKFGLDDDGADDGADAEKSVEVVLGDGSIGGSVPTEASSLLEKPKALQARGRGYSEPVDASNKHLMKEDADASGVTASVPLYRSAPRPSGKIERMIEFISNYDADSQGSTASGDDEDEFSGDTEITGGENGSAGAVFTNKPADHQRAPIKKHHSHDGWAARDADGSEPLMVFHPHHGGLVNLKHASSFDQHYSRHHNHHHDSRTLPIPETESHTKDVLPVSGSDYDSCQACVDGQPGRAPDGWVDAFRSGGQELVEHWSKLWDETYRSDEYSTAEKVLITCEMPFTVLRMLSIPVPCDGYYCRPLVALSIAVAPLWMWFYCYNQFGVDLMAGPTFAVVLVVLVPLVCALLILRFAPCGVVPMRLSVAVPITFVGFASSAAWLDLIADKLVSLLSFFGIMLHIPATIMGLTILAWGNSSQDLIANMTVAKKGLSTMAITASFAGPVFNILVGLGIGLTILTRQSHNLGEPVLVYLNNPLRVGFLFAILNGVLVIICGVVVGKGVIPKRFGYVAMMLYAAYVVASLTL